MSNITIINGNIFNTKAQTIVNTVNCVGVMGKGIALVFKLRYPAMFDIYQDFCKQGLIGIGKLWIYKGDARDPWVLNFPTKTHWKLPSEYEYIEKGLQKFVETYKEKGITSIAFPLLGANNGGLDGKKVEELMISYLSQCDIPIEIYHYDPQAPDDLFEEFRLKWKNCRLGSHNYFETTFHCFYSNTRKFNKRNHASNTFRINSQVNCLNTF